MQLKSIGTFYEFRINVLYILNFHNEYIDLFIHLKGYTDNWFPSKWIVDASSDKENNYQSFECKKAHD